MADISNTSNWMKSDDLIKVVTKGDLIEIKRKSQRCINLLSYNHWGVYLGDGRLGHYVESDWKSGGVTRSFPDTPWGIENKKLEINVYFVTIDDLAKACEGDYCRKNNKYDREFPIFPDDAIARRVISRIGESDYDLFSNNCEHFANWARYNKHTSRQVMRLRNILIVVFGTVVLIGGVCVVWKFIELVAERVKNRSKLES
uniref:LRAT domain-containing protein n=1 Tax=Rhabditophanes sp. KR3021 TaxID=114890 RepID=A0AC35TVC5_9BILA